MTTYRLASNRRQAFNTLGQVIDYLLGSTGGVAEGLIDVEYNFDGQSRGRLKYILQDDLVIVRPTTQL